MARYKYNKRIANHIFRLIETDSYTIAQICESVGISESCYYKWQEGITEFTEGLKEAKDVFTRKTLIDCEKSLKKLINGYDYDEKKTVMISNKEEKPTIKEQTVIKKHVAPNLGAIIHYQTNKDPENWKNKQSTEITGKDGKPLIPEHKLTDEEREAEIEALRKELNV
jgi:hypothetical protein